MTLHVLLTKLRNAVSGAPPHVSLRRLSAAVDARYQAHLTKASSEHEREKGAIVKAAQAEAEAVVAHANDARQRAVNLRSTGLLSGRHADLIKGVLA